jgi:hypothetical protein
MWEAAITSFLIALLVLWARQVRPGASPAPDGSIELHYAGFVRGLGAALALLSGLISLLSYLTREPGVVLKLGPFEARDVNGGIGATVAWLVPVAAGVGLAVWSSFTTFRVDDHGITRRTPWGSEIAVTWPDVRFVHLDGNQVITIVAAHQTLTLSPWLKGRPALAARLLQHVPPEKFGSRRDAVVATLRQQAAAGPY